MLDALRRTGDSPIYWMVLLIAGIAFEAVALYYQYILEEPPCVLCIHVRLWVAALVLIALSMIVLGRFLPSWAGHVMTLGIALALSERSYQLLGNERGFIIGACGFDTGLPSWFTPDVWWPALFEVQTTCGYTPELLFGITMAEFLIVSSVIFSVLCVAMLLALISKRES